MKEDKHEYRDKTEQEMLDSMKRNRLIRTSFSIGANVLFTGYLLLTPKGWKELGKSDTWNLLFHTEGRKGMLEDAIIQNPLYFPNEEGTGLTYEDALAGKWAGYDFHRKAVFGKGKQLRKGKLCSFILEEIKENSPEMHTPTDLFQFFDAYHLLTLETPSIDHLIKKELMVPKTYREAYQKAGAYEQYAHALAVMELSDKIVYQVTPKGNTLVFLEDEGGTPKRRREPQREPAFGKPAY